MNLTTMMAVLFAVPISFGVILLILVYQGEADTCTLNDPLLCNGAAVSASIGLIVMGSLACARMICFAIEETKEQVR